MSNEIVVASGNSSAVPIAMQIMFDQAMFDRTKQIAGYMANARGFTPPHLLGKTEACFAVVMRSITWKLDPFAVACSTYDVHGKVGFEGKLCQAILENSGRIDGQIEYEYYGDWTKVQGKFKKSKSEKGNEYAVPTYTPEDEKGLGVIIRAQLKGESKKREFQFEMVQAFPRNSTLWATDPKTQLGYTAIRRFASSAAPSLIMGVPFDSEDNYSPKDVTPADNSGLKDAFMSHGSGNAEAKRPENGLDKILETKAQDAVEVVAEIIMPSGEVVNFPNVLDTIGLMGALQEMTPPDEKEFFRNNIDILPKVIDFMKANDKPKAAESLEKMLSNQ